MKHTKYYNPEMFGSEGICFYEEDPTNYIRLNDINIPEYTDDNDYYYNYCDYDDYDD